VHACDQSENGRSLVEKMSVKMPIVVVSCLFISTDVRSILSFQTAVDALEVICVSVYSSQSIRKRRFVLVGAAISRRRVPANDDGRFGDHRAASQLRVSVATLICIPVKWHRS
jgi:hypothetical protein